MHSRDSSSFDVMCFHIQSLAVSVPPSLARSACKSMLRFGSRTLELSAAECRPKGIRGQSREKELERQTTETN